MIINFLGGKETTIILRVINLTFPPPTLNASYRLLTNITDL